MKYTTAEHTQNISYHKLRFFLYCKSCANSDYSSMEQIEWHAKTFTQQWLPSPVWSAMYCPVHAQFTYQRD